MKLRIKGNSLRLRLSRSEVDGPLETGRVEETVHFDLDQDPSFTYALEHTRSERDITMLHCRAFTRKPTRAARLLIRAEARFFEAGNPCKSICDIERHLC